MPPNHCTTMKSPPSDITTPVRDPNQKSEEHNIPHGRPPNNRQHKKAPTSPPRNHPLSHRMHLFTVEKRRTDSLTLKKKRLAVRRERPRVHPEKFADKGEKSTRSSPAVLGIAGKLLAERYIVLLRGVRVHPETNTIL